MAAANDGSQGRPTGQDKDREIQWQNLTLTEGIKMRNAKFLEASHSLTILGHPVVLKNSKQICLNRKTGKSFIKSNQKVDAYRHRAIAQIRYQWGNRAPCEGPLHVQIEIYGAWRSDSGNLPDLSNLYQMPEDLIEQCGVIVDDRQIASHNGSRRICLCDGPCMRRPIYKSGPKKGEKKPSCESIKACPYERVTISIEPMNLPNTSESVYTARELGL